MKERRAEIRWVDCVQDDRIGIASACAWKVTVDRFVKIRHMVVPSCNQAKPTRCEIVVGLKEKLTEEIKEIFGLFVSGNRHGAVLLYLFQSIG
jgi:hypothetical protein